MPGGPNLSSEELQQLRDLLETFKGSREVQEAAQPEDHECMQGTLTLINFIRLSHEGDIE